MLRVHSRWHHHGCCYCVTTWRAFVLSTKAAVGARGCCACVGAMQQPACPLTSGLVGGTLRALATQLTVKLGPLTRRLTLTFSHLFLQGRPTGSKAGTCRYYRRAILALLLLCHASSGGCVPSQAMSVWWGLWKPISLVISLPASPALSRCCLWHQQDLPHQHMSLSGKRP